MIYYGIHCQTPSELGRVHRLVHRLATEFVAHTLILHEVCACESLLVARFPFVACGTGVPVLHVQSMCEANICVGVLLHNVGNRGIGGPCYWAEIPQGCREWVARRRAFVSVPHPGRFVAWLLGCYS